MGGARNLHWVLCNDCRLAILDFKPGAITVLKIYTIKYKKKSGHSAKWLHAAPYTTALCSIQGHKCSTYSVHVWVHATVVMVYACIKKGQSLKNILQIIATDYERMHALTSRQNGGTWSDANVSDIQPLLRGKNAGIWTLRVATGQGPHSRNKRHSPWVTFWRQPPVAHHKTVWLDRAKTVKVCENNNRGNAKVTFFAYHAFLIDPMDQYLRSTSYRSSVYSDKARVNRDGNRAYLFGQIFGALHRNDLVISKLNIACSSW